MKLIIDIPEKVYQNAKTDMLCGSEVIVNAIKNGIPQEPIIDKIRAEIHASAVMKPDYEWYVNEKRIMQIIDRYSQEV